MNLIIQAPNSSRLRECLVAGGPGESVGAAKGEMAAILIAISGALGSTQLWSSMILKLADAFAGYFKNSASAGDRSRSNFRSRQTKIELPAS